LAVFSLGLAVVTGRSMEPSLYDGDRLLVHYGATPRPGRVAVVRLPDRPVAVKRLVSRLEDGWWVARDNPSMGVDSAQVGSIPEEDVLGCVVLRVWPVRRRRPRRDLQGRTGTGSGEGG
jgi:nickel-type superoxide dismutase maturation protease